MFRSAYLKDISWYQTHFIAVAIIWATYFIVCSIDKHNILQLSDN